MNIEIEFMEAVNGTQKTVTFGRTDTCETCKGTKTKQALLLQRVGDVEGRVSKPFVRVPS